MTVIGMAIPAPASFLYALCYAHLESRIPNLDTSICTRIVRAAGFAAMAIVVTASWITLALIRQTGFTA